MDPHEITAESLTFMGADFCEGLAVFKEICDLMLLWIECQENVSFYT